MVLLRNQPVLRSHHPSTHHQDILQADHLPEIHLANHNTMDDYDRGCFVQIKHASVAY